MSIINQKMIFITGASRSGTTLLSFMLRNHSQVFGLKETQYFGEFWDPRNPKQQLSEHQLLSAAASVFARQTQGILNASKPTHRDLECAHSLVDSLSGENRSPAALYATVVSQLTTEAGKSIPCEQTPRNIFYAEALLRTYPEALIIHIMRDPRGVMASQKSRWRKRRFAADREAYPLLHSLRVWVNYHPYTVAKLWSRASREAQRLKSHPRFMLIRFEDLLEAPESTIRLLCDHLHIGFEPSMLEVGQINSSHQSSVGGARKGLHKDAIGMWRTILSHGEIAVVERLCGKIMAQNGYETIEDPPPNRGNELRYKLTYLLHIIGVLAVNPRRAWIQWRATPNTTPSNCDCGHQGTNEKNVAGKAKK